MIDEDDYGDVGESVIRNIASKCSMTCTEPHRDKYGWDFVLEFSNPAAPVFLDSSDSKYTVFVQVKAFGCDYSEYKGRDIKLSNVHHMITTPQPVFVAYVDVNTEDVYLVHLNRQLVYDGLKAIRHAQVKGDALHKRLLSINPHTRQAIKVESSKTPAAFKETLLMLIEGTPSAYTEQKQIWKREVGYEKGAYQFEASISNGDLQNLYLGVIDRLEIDVRNFSDNRFGIALPYDSLPEKVEMLSNEYAMELGLPVVERGIECRLEIINIITDQSVAIEGRLVKNAGQSFAFFTHKFFKLAIDLTKSENNVSGQFLLHKFESGKLTMQEMTRLLKVMHLLSSGQRSVIEFHCDECLLRFDIEPVIKETQDEFGVSLDKLLEFVVDFKWLLLQLDIDVATLLSFHQLCEHYHRFVTPLSQIRQKQPLTLRFNLEQDVSKEVIMEREHYCYLPTRIPILGKHYWVLICYNGQVQWYEKGVVFSSLMSASIACFREHRTTKDAAEFADRTKRRVDVSAKKGVATVVYQILPDDALPIFEKKIKLGMYAEH